MLELDDRFRTSLLANCSKKIGCQNKHRIAIAKRLLHKNFGTNRKPMNWGREGKEERKQKDEKKSEGLRIQNEINSMHNQCQLRAKYFSISFCSASVYTSFEGNQIILDKVQLIERRKIEEKERERERIVRKRERERD